MTVNSSGLTFDNPVAPEGVQVGYIQGGAESTISQTIQNWAAGTYRVAFLAAQRGNFQFSSQVFQVLIDGQVVGVFEPNGTNYETYATPLFTVAAGTHTVTFQGIDPDGGDNTVLLDAVAIC